MWADEEKGYTDFMMGRSVSLYQRCVTLSYLSPNFPYAMLLLNEKGLCIV